MADIRPFLLDPFPMTQAFYFSITAQKPSAFNGENHPVESVSWLEAITCCNVLSGLAGLEKCYSGIEAESALFHPEANGYRLPTEAEWEFACRAGTTSARYGNLDEIGWYKENSGGSTHPVGLKQPNTWGLFDMLGNVWEWCSDCYDEQVYGSYRIFRGGGWSDAERGCLATNRRRSHPFSFKIDDLGFRLARDL